MLKAVRHSVGISHDNMVLSNYGKHLNRPQLCKIIYIYTIYAHCLKVCVFTRYIYIYVCESREKFGEHRILSCF